MEQPCAFLRGVYKGDFVPCSPTLRHMERESTAPSRGATEAQSDLPCRPSSSRPSSSLGSNPVVAQAESDLAKLEIQTRAAERSVEVDALRLRPHPYEFCMYYDI